MAWLPVVHGWPGMPLLSATTFSKWGWPPVAPLTLKSRYVTRICKLLGRSSLPLQLQPFVDRAVALAAVAVDGVAVVAVFAARLQTVAAEHVDDRAGPDRHGRLFLAGGAAAVTGDHVAVVAAFARVVDVVAAHRVDARRAGGRALVAGLDLAAGVAAVAAELVAVVALLDADLLAVAAAWQARRPAAGQTKSGFSAQPTQPSTVDGVPSSHCSATDVAVFGSRRRCRTPA